MDVVSFLEWAYGEKARAMFMTGRNVLGQRSGQSLMNTLSQVDCSAYIKLTGSLVDPFYDDAKIPAALDLLTKK